jgi:hypothetical protein
MQVQIYVPKKLKSIEFTTPDFEKKMKNKEHARRDELDSLKVNMTHITSLLEQVLNFYPRHKCDPCKIFREEAGQNWKIEPTPIIFKK